MAPRLHIRGVEQLVESAPEGRSRHPGAPPVHDAEPMTSTLRELWNDESGQGLTEYALVTGAVASLMAALAYLFRDDLATLLETVGDNMEAKVPVVNT